MSRSVVFLLGFIFLSIDCGVVYGQSPDLYLRAPDVIPGTLPEMRTSSYWIHRMNNADEVVMSKGQISELNNVYQQRMHSFVDDDSDTGQRIREQLNRTPGLFAFRPDIHSLSSSELSDQIQIMIQNQIDFIIRRPFGNILGVEYTDHEIEALKDEMSIDTIPKQISPKPGITVTDSRIRIIPSLRPEYIGLTQTGKSRWDVWNLDILPIATPLQILHRSKSGGHLFVFTNYGFGWVKSENVATANQLQIEEFINSDRYVVSIGDNVPFYSNSNSEFISGWLRMGAKLPLVNSENNRLIQVPVRQMNGRLSVQEAWFSSDAEINVGYLPYTRKNVVELSFKMLDNLYDWTGGWYGRNDGTVLRDMFKTFGFKMPANGVFLSLFTENRWVSSSEVPINERFVNIIDKASPFTTFMVSRSGHSLLYIGEYEGVPVVFDTHGYGYENDIGEEIEIRRWSVATLSLPDYLLRQDVTITNIY